MIIVYHNKIQHRVKRVQGQLGGVLNMMEQEKPCQDVINQLSAARAAIDKTIAIIVAENLRDCVVQSVKDGKDSSEEIEKAIRLLTKSK